MSVFLIDHIPAMKKFHKIILIVLFFSPVHFSYAQSTSLTDTGIYKEQGFKDSSVDQISYPYDKKRVRLVTAANVLGYGGALVILNETWYSKEPQTSFHFFNDNAEWLQVDKAGHVYSAYMESRAGMELWRWAGLDRKKRIWIGGLTGAAYQTVIEILDGFASDYGFSAGDFAANMVGSAAFISQELAWNEQRIKIKYSLHTNDYKEADLEARADMIYGKGVERMLKDYNAQTYWLSANLHSFLPKANLPRWLSIAAGYGADGMFGARSNIARNKDGQVIFDRSDLPRYRQWYLSPDIDFTRIRTNKKGLKILFFVLSAVKFPAPALEFSRGKIIGHWIVF